MLRRSEKTRKLRELHGELTTLDTDIQQVEAQAGPAGGQGGPPAPPERPSEAELLRRRIAESTGRAAELPGHPLAAAPARAPPGLPGLCTAYMCGSASTRLLIPASQLNRDVQQPEKIWRKAMHQGILPNPAPSSRP